MDEAYRYFLSGDTDRAIEVYKAALKKNPDLAPIQITMAHWYGSTNQAAQARKALEQAVAETPGDPEAYASLGQLALRNGQYTEAELLYAKALDVLKAALSASVPRAVKLKLLIEQSSLSGLARVAEARRDWPAAQKRWEELVAVNPADGEALNRLGRALFQQKKSDEAYEKFKQAAAVDGGKTLANAEASMATLYMQAGDLSSAGEWMLKGIKEHDHDLRTRLIAVDYSLRIPDFNQAMEQAQAAVKLSPHSSDALMSRGLVALHTKDYAAAEKYLQEAHLAAMTDFAVLDYLTIALCEQKDEAKQQMAVDLAQLNTRAFPDKKAEAFATLAWALYKAGKLPEAESALAESLKSGRPHPDGAYYLSRILFAGGHKDQARLVAAQVLSPAINSPAPFLRREDTKALFDELKK